MLSVALAAGAARAAPPGPGPAGPAPPPARDGAEPRRLLELIGFGAELGGTPGLFGAELGVGAPRGPADDPRGRWMAWIEADGTDWFRPSQPADAGRVDRILWIYPHAELRERLVRRWDLSGWIEAGPTLGRYTAGGGVDTLWFPGVAAGAGIQLSPVRLGVTWYGQWKTSTVRAADAFASTGVRMAPMVLVTAGLEHVLRIPR
jgi:hypothetical protein